MQLTKEEILNRYQLSAADALAQGMEAEVYRYGDNNVLKLYRGRASRANLRALQCFYATLDASRLSYALPQIITLTAHGDYTVSVEPRLDGQPMVAHLATLSADRLAGHFHTYIQAVSELGHLTMPPTRRRYKLFDRAGLSLRAAGDWHHFLHSWLQHRLCTLATHFAVDVNDFSRKRHAIERWLATPYTGPHALIHGDFFPGNILVNGQGKVQALLDFGLFTMYGDPLFDVATAWLFFDMYDEWQANVRGRLLDAIIATLGESVRDKLYRYVLLYSLLSANIYAPDCSDGHYRWCVANLNHDDYWSAIAD